MDEHFIWVKIDPKMLAFSLLNVKGTDTFYLIGYKKMLYIT